MMGSINYITTVINMRAPGMKLFRMPLVIWSLFITAILLLLALPVLTSGVAMLLFDRTLGTSWFKPSGGGEPLLWQHLFWYFGHPVVPLRVLARQGHRLRDPARVRAQAGVRLPRHGLLDDRDRVPVLDRLRPPHVRERHEPRARHVVHGDHDDHCRPLGHQDL